MQGADGSASELCLTDLAPFGVVEVRTVVGGDLDPRHGVDICSPHYGELPFTDGLKIRPVRNADRRLRPCRKRHDQQQGCNGNESSHLVRCFVGFIHCSSFVCYSVRSVWPVLSVILILLGLFKSLVSGSVLSVRVVRSQGISFFRLVLSCLVLSCLVLSCLVLSALLTPPLPFFFSFSSLQFFPHSPAYLSPLSSSLLSRYLLHLFLTPPLVNRVLFVAAVRPSASQPYPCRNVALSFPFETLCSSKRLSENSSSLCFRSATICKYREKIARSERMGVFYCFL